MALLGQIKNIMLACQPAVNTLAELRPNRTTVRNNHKREASPAWQVLTILCCTVVYVVSENMVKTCTVHKQALDSQLPTNTPCQHNLHELFSCAKLQYPTPVLPACYSLKTCNPPKKLPLLLPKTSSFNSLPCYCCCQWVLQQNLSVLSCD